MVLSNIPCYYHKNRIALAVCERCKAPICLEDKYTEKISYRGHLIHNYCLFCYYNRKKRYSHRILYPLLSIIGYLVVYVVYEFIGGMYNPIYEPGYPFTPADFFFLISLIFYPLIVFSIINSFSKYFKMLDLETEISNSVQKKSTEEESIESYSKPIFCYKCKKEINFEEDYCSKCGFISSDELIDNYGLLNLN